MKGIYSLLLGLPNRLKIRVGRLGMMVFEKGYYAYVGSAMNGLEARINRHLRGTKKQHWHIDYLLNNGVTCIHDVYFYGCDEKGQECGFARRLNSNFKAMKNFGSSDCNCESHLFHSKSHSELQKAITRGGMARYDSADKYQR